MQRRTWSRAWCWPAGSGGPIWSSPAWRTRRRSNSSGRSHGRRSAAGRRSSWPNGTAGPTSLLLEAPTSHSQARCSARGGPTRQSPGSSGPSAPSCRKPSPRWGRGSVSCAGCWSWRAAASPTHWPPAGPPSGFRGTLPPRTAVISPRRRGDCCCTPWCAWAPSTAPSRSWAACVTRTATAARPASPRRCCGWPRTTRARRPPRWRRFWTAPPPWPGRTGGLTFSCWRRSSGTHSATGPPPGARSSVPSISPSPIVCLPVPHLPCAGCWSATPGTAANTRPWARRSSPCFHHWSQASRNGPPIGIRALKRYCEAGSPPVGRTPVGKSGWGDRSPELIEPLSRSEMRVLRYLPTNLSAPEIARELSVSVTTVRTHISHLFVKLGAHRRTEAVARARDLGLLAPSPMRRPGQPRRGHEAAGPAAPHR